MTIHNLEIAEKFTRLANLLEIEGDNPFRIRAYRNAARIINSMGVNVADLIAQETDLTTIPGIGKDLAEKIATIVKTGQLPVLNEIEAHTPAILNELMKIDGLGPKRIKIIYKKLRIKTIADLKVAIQKGRLQKLPGFAEKTEQKILHGIENLTQYSSRIKLADAFPMVDTLLNYLRKNKHVINIECAGSFRRRKETVGDLDIVVATKDNQSVISHFVNYNDIADIISQGDTRASIRLKSGMQVDLRAVPEKSYGAALLYFTGSKEHNIAIRKIGVQRKLKINEYGVYKGKKYLAGKTEQEVYRQINLAYIEPELREDSGEILAAQNNQLPKLITLKDIRGDLKCRTRGSSGIATLEAMVDAAIAKNYEYLAVADHAKHLHGLKGLDKDDILAQIKLIDKLNAKLNNFIIFKSIEVDILADGKLALSHSLLKLFDFVICSIHSSLNLPEKQQTERLIRAMDNPYCHILANPTGRLINDREPYQINTKQIITAAIERNCILELNAQPERLDLNSSNCKLAKELGAKISISSAAQSEKELMYVQFGIYEARRGWLEKADVVNTLPPEQVLQLLRR